MLKRLLESLSDSIMPASRMVVPDVGAYIELLGSIDGGAGIELTHEDEYAAMQDQIAKRGDIDDSVVLGNATLLLRDRGKDLRAAVFMAYSALRVDGLRGLLPVLGLIHALINGFGDSLHPRKAVAKQAALEWLCSERFVDPLTLHAQRATEKTLLDLQRCLQGLVESVECWTVDSRPDLTGLTQRVDQWLVVHSRDELRRAVSHGAVSEPSLPDMSGSASQGTALNPESSTDAWHLIRKASAVLRSDPLWAESGRTLLRAARWSSLTLIPPNERGVTRLVAPRKEARVYVEGLHASAQWELLLDEVPRVFNEASNHLWLDLWWYADQACSRINAGGAIAREQLAHDLRGLLTRLPQLPTLKFDDASALASLQTQSWLATLLKPPQAVSPLPSTYSTGRDDAVLFDKAKSLLRSQGVAAALSLIQKQMTESMSQSGRFELQRLSLRIALDDGRSDLAIGLARGLARQVDEFALDRWNPDDAFDVWATLFDLLRSNGEGAQPEARHVYSRLCGIDAAHAANLQ